MANHQTQHQDRLGHHVIVIGASLGGVEDLSRLSAGLPANLPVAIFLVVHTLPYARSLLPHLAWRFREKAEAMRQHGEVIREILLLSGETRAQSDVDLVELKESKVNA